MESSLNKFNSLILGTGNVLDNEEMFKKVKSPIQEVNKMCVIILSASLSHIIDFF